MAEYNDNLKHYDIVKNPDENFYLKITSAVEKNGMYCPCLIVKNDDTICSCKQFRESFLTEEDVKNGKYELFCHCKRFKKVLKEEFHK